MYFTYILYSQKCDRYYIGYCEDILTRLKRHNDGMVTATRNCRPYIVKATKSFATEPEARKEELRLKKQKSRKYIEGLTREIGRNVPLISGTGTILSGSF